MASILLVSSGIPSPLNSVVAFAEQLRADGHTVSVAAPKQAAAIVESRRLTFREIPPPKVNAFAPLITRPKLFDRVRPGEYAKRIALAQRAFGVDKFPDLLASAAPDLLIVDAELHAHVMIAHSKGYRTALCSSMYVTPPSPQRPPLHYSIVPSKGVLGSRAAIRMAWIWYWAWRALTIAKKKVLYHGGDYASAAARLAEKHGFDLAAQRDNRSWQMPWSLKLRTLVFLPGALDFPPQELPKHDYVGPMILARDDDQETTRDVVEEFLGSSKGKVRLYAAFGTLLTPEPDFLKRLWEAIRRNSDWTLLCVLGRNAQGAPEPPPQNVLLADWVPQAELLTHADAFLLPGGTASIVEAVAAKTPMLIYPRTIDQYGNGARITYHGLGQVGRGDDTAEQIENRLRQILADPEMASRLERFKAAQEAYAKNRLAQDVVAEILASDHG